MRNSSQVSHFILGAYFDTGPLRWLYFFIIMSVYVLIVLSNLLLIIVICLNRSLHEPMYIFLCSLFVSEIFGSTVLCPFLLFQVLQDAHTASVSLCLLQIFGLYTYGAVNFTNLGVMSYDRYIAICFPLQYNTRMNFKKVTILIISVWVPSVVVVIVLTSLTASLSFCENIVDDIYCDNYRVVKLSCFDTTASNLYELICAAVIILFPLGVIFFTYIQILKVCFNGSKQTQQKALSTCTPHLCSLLNFAFGASFQIIQSRFDLKHVPLLLRNILKTYHVICEPLVNSLVYGLNLSKIRNGCKKLLLKLHNKIM